jgi:transposase-like protein
MVIRIAGERMYLWRAADYFGKARICLADPR